MRKLWLPILLFALLMWYFCGWVVLLVFLALVGYKCIEYAESRRSQRDDEHDRW